MKSTRGQVNNTLSHTHSTHSVDFTAHTIHGLPDRQTGRQKKVVAWKLIKKGSGGGGGGFFLACEDLGRMFNYSPPVLFLFFVVVFRTGGWLMHTNSTLYARISPQWISELR